MKKLAIYLLMMLSLLMVCFTLFSKIVNAETSKKVDVITDVKVQNNDGGDLTAPLGRYDTFRLNAKFALEGRNVKAGDTTEVVIASPIDIKSQDFEIKDSITGKLIANAKVDATTGKIVLTFTKFVEEKNDISGSFFFYAGVNKDKFPNDSNAPVKVSVDNKVKFDGTVKSGTVGEGKRYTIIKSGWDNGDHKSLGFRISVNRTNEAITNAVLSDSIESPGVTYKAGSFKIYKGTWDYSTGTWQLQNKTDVTSQYTVNATDTTFTINLGNISANDHFAVEYEAVVNYDAVDREVIKNKATIVGDNKKPYDSQSKVNIQIAGGEGVGYAFGIQVHKVDESNKPLKGAKFQVIRQATGQVLGEFESDAKGEFSLKELLRDKYIIKEIQAPEGYGLAEDTIVEASEFTTPTKPVSKTIVNKKEKPAKTQATIELDKNLTGRDLVDGEFSFELYEGENKLQTTTNQSGKITFEPIEFTAEGEHTYTVKEVKGNDATITYDASEKQVTVKVTRDGGALKAEVVYPESKTFTNAFTPKATTATIELSKELTGRELVDGEFSFELYEGANKLQTVTNKSGKVTFDAISYTEEGEHTYTVKEVKGDNATIAYDASEKQVTVKVTRDGDTLKAEVVYPENKTFTNAFTPNATTASIELTKELTGRDLVDGEFSFELYEGANKLQTVTNKNGKITFEPITYDEVGEHTYTVKEVAGNTPGITYDKADKQVTVKVKKDGDNLKADVAYPENKAFKNTYTAPKPAKAKISASKILEGAELKNGEFSFNLLDESGKVLQTKQNAADGSVAFDEISYSQEDAGKTFHYTIKEVIPQSQEKGMTYDQASIEVTVTVTKDDASNTIKATVAYGAKTSFTNTFVTSEIPPTPPVVEKPEAKLYTIQLHKVNGEGQALAGAVFGLFEADGSTPVANPYGEGQATATSDANGLVSFVGFEAKNYVVKELTAPEGYQLSTASIAVSATELSAASDMVVDKGNVVNQPFTEIPPTPPVVEKPELTLYSIQLHKVNNEGQALAGAVFGLFEADGTTPVANPYGEGQATATSDSNGLVTFTGLEAKDYVVKEITAPEGYQLSEEAITVSSSQLIASADQVLDRGKVVNKPFTAIPPTPPVVEKPELKLYTIQLHKVNPFYQDLAGAVFGLFEADGVTPVANPYGEGQATATSDANGLVRFVGFEAKDYVVKELTAPAGYQLSTDSITVSAAELTAVTDLVVDKGNVVNQLTPPKGNTPPPSTDKPRKEIPSNPPKGNTPPPSTGKPEKEIPSNTPKEDKKEVLPSTGQSVSEGLVVAGLALAVAGSTLVYKKREN